MEYIITFLNTNHAIKAEQCLLGAGFSITVLPLPSQISEGCGICLKVSECEAPAALAALAGAGIPTADLYSRSKLPTGHEYALADSAVVMNSPAQTGQGENYTGSEGTTMGDKNGGLVVVMSRDTMGEGPRELGKILAKSFITSLAELATPPDTLIFLNSGVLLLAEGENTVEGMLELAAKGCEVLACGTCVSFFEMPGIAAGSISNMGTIVSRMAASGTLINI